MVTIERAKQHQLIRMAIISLLLAFIFTASARTSDANALIPVDAYAALPSFSGAQLSPSGKKLAYFVEHEGKRHLIVGKLDGSSPFIVPPPEKQTLLSFQWKNDATLLYTASLSVKRRSLMVRTDETRVYRLDVATSRSRRLVAPNRINLRETDGQHERIVSTLPHDPEHILIELDLNRSGDYEVYLSNLNSGHRKLVQREQRYVQRWRADASGTIRLATGFRRSKRITQLKIADGRWVDLNDLKWASNYTVEGFTDNPDIIYVRGNNKFGMQSLYTLDLTSGNIIDTLFSRSSIDMNSAIFSAQTGKIIGVSYIDDFRRIQYFDKTLTKIQHSIDLALPETVNTVSSISSDLSLYFVFAHNARDPGSYYIYNRSEGTLSFVASSRAQIEPSLSADTKTISIPASDNSTIPAYLTVPTGIAEPRNMPVIVLPHGGPFGVRDDATWDHEAQFYASRGYLVLKPNFRGSGGYGAPFIQAGLKQWGGIMQDDVADAAQWLIDQGYADPNRICIVGGSYGGYAALMGAILTPDLYQCAVSVNGVTDLVRMKGNDRIYSVGGRSWSGVWGLEGASDESVSPYHRAQDINLPVLIMASPDDARVPFKMSQDMHEKLRKNNKNSTFVRIENGTHNMVNAKSRRTVLSQTLKFIEQHIGRHTTTSNPAN